MTIKGRTSKELYNNIKLFITEYGKVSFGLVGMISLVWIIIYLISTLQFTNSRWKKFSLDLIRNEYPSLICVSPQGGIRIYENKTYTVFNDPDNGWQVYNTKQGHTIASTFHISKCELK